MAIASRIDGDLKVTGNILCGSDAIPAQGRSTLNLRESLARFPVRMTDFRIWDAFQTPLGATPTSDDDLALVGGTFGTTPPMIQAGDVKAVTKTRRARVQVVVPECYDAAQTMQFILSCGMITTIADASCTVDLEVYRHDKDGGISADLCATSATTMNSLSFSDKAFTITATSISAGDVLDVRLTIASIDAATATAVTPAVAGFDLACDIKG